MTAKRGRGRVALPPGDKRRVKVSPHLTEGEAARLDAVRGEVERAVMVREATLAMVRRLEASDRAKGARAARAALVMP